MTLIANWNISNPVTYARLRSTMLESGGGLQEGVVGANDLKVIQRGAGANQSVDVGTGAAWVAIDTGTRNGLGHVYSDATANVVVTASNATNPRIDQILLRWNDSSIPTGSGNTPTLEVLTGTATVGATLDNRTGATALPNDCCRLADILVPATSTSVTTANIRDRRPWARGAYSRIARTGGNYTTTATAATEVDATNLKPRIECSGAPLLVTFTGLATHSVPATSVGHGLFLDGAAIDGTGALFISNSPSAAGTVGFITRYVTVPTVGTHLISPTYFGGAAGTTTMLATTVNPATLTIEEIVRPNANNT